MDEMKPEIQTQQNDAAHASLVSRYQAPGAAWQWLICVLLFGAMAVSSMLLMQSLTGSTLPGCGAQTAFDCDSVLASRWSKWLGLPVSALAMMAYVTLLVLLQLGNTGSIAKKRLAWRLIVVIAVTIILSAVWFVGLQVVMKQYCLYCMIAHGLGALASIFLLVFAPIGQARVTADEPADAMMIPPGRPLMKWMSLSLLLVAVLLAGQWLGKPAPTVVQPAVGGGGGF